MHHYPVSSSFLEWYRETKRVDLWLTLAWYDTTLRYRRSLLGPLWLTVSTGALLLGMGPLYATLFGQPLSRFFPHLTLGIVFWNFFTSTLNDGCSTLVTNAHYLKEPGVSLVVLAWRTLLRNLLQLGHTIWLYLPVMIWADITPSLTMLLFPAALLTISLILHALVLLLCIATARFRDIGQITSSSLTLLMFLTPVFWLPDSLPNRAQAILYNPLAQMLALLRDPLLGKMPSLLTLMYVLFLLLTTSVAAFGLYHTKRKSVPYWL